MKKTWLTWRLLGLRGEEIRKLSSPQKKGHIQGLGMTVGGALGREDPVPMIEKPAGVLLVVDLGPAELDPPAAEDSSANPTDAGEERNTVYTFFYKKKNIYIYEEQ